MKSVPEAEKLIAESLGLSQTITMKSRQAVGQVLRQTIVAERAHPPFDRVAMDGVAIHLESHHLGTIYDVIIKIEAVQKAGEAQKVLNNPLGAIEVMTGAPLPANCNCVIRYEDTHIEKDQLVFKSSATFKSMQNVHQKGVDFQKDAPLLLSGALIKSSEVGIIISQGYEEVLVGADPRVAIISTGDELVDCGHPIKDYQIRRSNPYAVEAELRDHHFSNIDLFHLKDKKDEVIAQLKTLLASYDFFILSGGVSKGKFDFIPEAMEQLGVEKIFHKVSQRPGKPLWFGRTEKGQGVFALPGNPVSALINMRRYVIPALLKFRGLQVKPSMGQGILAHDYTFKKDLTCFKAVKKMIRDGQELVEIVEGNGSGDYSHLGLSDGFIELPREKENFYAGESYPLYLWGRI